MLLDDAAAAFGSAAQDVAGVGAIAFAFSFDFFSSFFFSFDFELSSFFGCGAFGGGAISFFSTTALRAATSSIPADAVCTSGSGAFGFGTGWP